MSNDLALGLMVHKYLTQLGIETPAEFADYSDDRINQVYHAQIEQSSLNQIQMDFRTIMKFLNLDLTDDSLRDTPARVAKMYVKELFTGLDYRNFPKCTVVENKMKYDELVISRGIEIKSVCEHHWQPIVGRAHIGYIPRANVLGLSKFNRVAQFFARRPQVQERLTVQIAAALQLILETDDVAVIIEAEHFCVKMRGVEDFCSDTVTSKMGGKFMEKPALREEFLELCRKQ